MSCKGPRSCLTVAFVVAISIAVPGRTVVADYDPIPDLGPAGSQCTQPGVMVTACGHTRLQVKGRAIYVTPHGELHLVRGLNVSLAYPMPSSDPKVSVRRRRSGSFSFSADLSHEVRTTCENGVVRAYEVWGRKEFVFQASGCEDLVVEVKDEWRPHDVVMQCTVGTGAG